MELWIRSQDKEDLIKVDNLGLAYEGKYAFVDNDRIDDKFYICQFTNNFHAKLGVYATKERALEVLEEIQTHLLKMGEIEMLTNENGIINGVKDYGIVYEMPKD